MQRKSVVTYWIFFLLLAIITLPACTTHPARAPVIDRLPTTTSKAPSTKPAPVKTVKTPDWRPATYTVQKGDTLYSIALEHGQDYKDVAAWNNISPPYTIQIGQNLRMQAPVAQNGTVPLKTAQLPEARPLAPGEILLKKEPKAVKLPYSDQALAQLNQETVAPAPPAGCASQRPPSRSHCKAQTPANRAYHPHISP